MINIERKVITTKVKRHRIKTARKEEQKESTGLRKKTKEENTKS
jgi:hypothetical protein